MGDDAVIFFVWMFSMVIGALIGGAKGRVGSGLVWSALLGPLGVVLVLCLPNLEKERKEMENERKEQQARETAREQLRVQERQLQILESLKNENPPPSTSGAYLIRKNGIDIGDMPLEKIQRLLQAGALTTADFYFDPQVNQWIRLEFLCNPKPVTPPPAAPIAEPDEFVPEGLRGLRRRRW